jgi:hypothetical protein
MRRLRTSSALRAWWGEEWAPSREETQRACPALRRFDGVRRDPRAAWEDWR